MKIKTCILALATSALLSCSSSDKRAEAKSDSITNMPVSDSVGQDSTAKDAVNATGSMNGSNNSGVNSSDGKPQKAN